MSATAIADPNFQPSPIWQAGLASEDIATFEEPNLARRRPREAVLWMGIEHRENILLDKLRAFDVAVRPGQSITAAFLAREAQKSKLKSLVEHFCRDYFSWGALETPMVSWETRLAVSRFLELLPEEIACPQIAPDSEGGVTLHWETLDHRHHLGGIDGWRLHFVFCAGQEDARYIDDLKFNDDEIPDEILQLLKEKMVPSGF
jgi:hypothetical protein